MLWKQVDSKDRFLVEKWHFWQIYEGESGSEEKAHSRLRFPSRVWVKMWLVLKLELKLALQILLNYQLKLTLNRSPLLLG